MLCKVLRKSSSIYIFVNFMFYLLNFIYFLFHGGTAKVELLLLSNFTVNVKQPGAKLLL